jgi:hypothetical protein
VLSALQNATRIGMRFAGGGARATLRRCNSLSNSGTGDSGIVALTTSGAASMGASSVSLTAGGKLTGRLVKGALLLLNGTTYTVGADVEASAGVLANVPIDPVLAAGVASGTLAMITRSYSETRYTVSNRKDLTGATDGEVNGARIELNLLPVAGETIARGDIVTFRGVALPVVEVDRVCHGEAILRYVVGLGELPGGL